jgi:cytochrome c biogenesis protein CcmG/thiol:disulfide interchange protein DsbE
MVDNSVFEGEWTVFNVWATWCPTCYVEHPYLMQMAFDGINLVGLNYKDEDDAARDYLANYGNPFSEIVVDSDGRFGLDLGVYGAPETFLINPDGEVVLRHVGEMNEAVWQEKFRPRIVATLPSESNQ